MKKLSYVLTGETLSNNNEFMEHINGVTISPKIILYNKNMAGKFRLSKLKELTKIDGLNII